MYYLLCFVFGALPIKGYSCTPAQVVAFAGGNIILPCSLNIPADDDVPTVEWSKMVGLKSSIVFLYRDGCETFEMKDLDFEYRTSLIMRDVKSGNVSLRISGVKLSDNGTYRCLIIQKNGTKEETKVELVVAAVSDPRLSVVFANSSRVTLECAALCWMPAPLMTILDDEGNKLTDEEPKQEQDVTTRCYNTKQSVTLQEPTRRVVCRVKHPQLNHIRTAVILLPALWKGSSITTTGIYVTLAISVFFNTIFILCLWLRKKPSNSDGGKPSPPKNKLDQTMTSDCGETNSLLNQQSLTDNMQNCILEELNKERRNPATIQIQDTSSWKPAACQHTQPGTS
ncbi:putative selection and upkeep of intraepithelial T-cells protein 1 homolog isoform X2 [Girardinichthys multiradiatus]|uniref:putative selection and upkeep of intraepithelial T-cells protein 1 homolog isoform X2 n=1 Tax=Girardinichthys multiradiatus TaxID=208333 RepID=UPI001FAD1F30|nr:putative selection and upkeep of intraepithelial T-cells protein 1 homolog isoform X2 [Girardinichthys multiradiatus]